MKTSMLLALAATTLAACGPVSDSKIPTENRRSIPAETSSADSDRLVVVELFQSQGCSSCPPANRNVNEIAGRDDILALSFAVTYWDRLGWKDTFAKPEFTQRQRDYAQKVSGFDVATPQVVVNGRQGLIGHRMDELDAVIADAISVASGPEIERRGDQLVIGRAATDGPSRVLLAVYDPRSIEVPISAGENNGRTLPHRNIVRDLIDLGEWNGTTTTLTLPQSNNSHYRTAILLQQGRGGPLVAAREF